jgi:hypothetical protein
MVYAAGVVLAMRLWDVLNRRRRASARRKRQEAIRARKAAERS